MCDYHIIIIITDVYYEILGFLTFFCVEKKIIKTRLLKII